MPAHPSTTTIPKPAWMTAALLAATAAGYGGRQVQIELRYRDALPTDASGWECSQRLADGTPVCQPKAQQEAPDAAGDAVIWRCQHVGPMRHDVSRGSCRFDVCEAVSPEVPTVAGSAAPRDSPPAPDGGVL